MNRRVLDDLKQHIPLLEHLQAHDWQPARALSRGRWMGLCPLHTDHKPSFLVDTNKGLFYCYGCGRGGDVIRFAELYHQVNFPKAITLLREWCGLAPFLNAVVDCYRIQLHPPLQAGQARFFKFDPVNGRGVEFRSGGGIDRYGHCSFRDPAIV